MQGSRAILRAVRCAAAGGYGGAPESAIGRPLVAKIKGAVPVRVERITEAILVARGQRVILDADLASLYGVTTKALNQAVRRNLSRFPEDFSFRLARGEVETLNRSQSVTGSQKHRNPRFPPVVFTEHGAIMAATILNSARAVEMSLYVVRAFVQLRELLASNTELERRLDELQRMLKGHDAAITAILSAIRELMNPPHAKRRGIGFTADVESTR
jgi:hypothetical protein